MHLFGHVHEGRGIFKQKPGFLTMAAGFFLSYGREQQIGNFCLCMVALYLLRPKRRNGCLLGIPPLNTACF